MPDIVSPQKRSEMMAGIKGKNTKPEILLRKALHAEGFRFRLHSATLPGKPDIILPRYKVAIFVNGCFWHGHDKCKLFRLPKSRTEFWAQKIQGNTERDRKYHKEIALSGWRLIIVWECALKNKKLSDLEALIKDIKKFILKDKKLYVEFR